MGYKHWTGIGAGVILGIILIIAGLGKLPYQAEFLAVILPGSFLSETQAGTIAGRLPWLGLIIGLLLFTVVLEGK